LVVSKDVICARGVFTPPVLVPPWRAAGMIALSVVVGVW
jgi:hypothetical protein